MQDYVLTETDLRMALLNRGFKEYQVARLLGDIKAKAWEEGARAGWGASNDCGVDSASYTYEEAEISNDNPYKKEA